MKNHLYNLIGLNMKPSFPHLCPSHFLSCFSYSKPVNGKSSSFLSYCWSHHILWTQESCYSWSIRALKFSSIYSLSQDKQKIYLEYIKEYYLVEFWVIEVEPRSTFLYFHHPIARVYACCSWIDFFYLFFICPVIFSILLILIFHEITIMFSKARSTSGCIVICESWEARCEVKTVSLTLMYVYLFTGKQEFICLAMLFIDLFMQLLRK